MKTAHEWLEEMKARPCVTEHDLLVIIERIQKDAQFNHRTVRVNRDYLDQPLNEGKGVYKP